MIGHLFFGKEKDKNSNVRKHKKLKDDVKSESFNTNPVLIALSENRLPEVQLNYEYLGELLASDALVAVKPRRCRIYVSTKKVHTDLDQNISHDTEGIDNNSALPCRYNYNCLEDRSDREEKDLVIRQELLHEYTWNMTQRESISVRDLSRKWESNFPELNEAFKVAVQDSRCDILHMHVTLDMHAAGGIPDGSDLNGMVDVTITQPALQSHRWKVITRLVRPHELCGVAETMLCEITNDIDELFQHGLGCDDIRPYCSCMRSQNDQDIRRLPFPAQQWATIFDLSAQYPPYPKERGADRHHSTDAEAQRHRTKLTSNRPNYLSEYHGRKRPYGQDKYETGGPATLDGCLTQLDLIRQVGMLQEMWSRPRKVHDQQGWTRRAVIAWTFDQYHPNLDARHKTAMLSAGTEWCFVTALDSDSSEYQKQMFVTRKETVQSNPRLYECQLDKMKTEIFSSPSDISQSTKQKQNDLGTAETYRSRMDILSNYDLNDIGVVDSLLSGIASAPLTAPVPLSFDTSAIGISDQLAKDTHYLQARKSTMMSAMTFLNSNLKAFGANGSVSDVVDNTSWRAAPLHGGSHQAGSALDWNRDRAPEGPSWNLSSSDWNGALDLEADLLVPDWIMAASDHGTLWARAIAPTWQRMDAELSQWKKERCLDERTNAVEGGEFETQPTRTSQQVPDRQPLLDGNFDDVTYDIGLYN
ncbi:hypothetical protein NKR23_g11888 [Pleurostoma richardsiae]|uniref:Uncharacterized protein n=1 Tax=Pleurostoma richardsiae TaxID=41990 RepID=A0AA38R925_9PEZI|nr:hypothetical protein NKR23_g11888 [Pleurostoma richardsiae]